MKRKHETPAQVMQAIRVQVAELKAEAADLKQEAAADIAKAHELLERDDDLGR